MTTPSHQGITAPGLTEADQNINRTTEDISHMAAGHKANLSNPSKSLALLFYFILRTGYSCFLFEELVCEKKGI